MPETLLSPSNVLLFGRELADLVVRHDPADSKGDKKKGHEDDIHGPFVKPRAGDNRFLDKQLADPDSKLARIYGFSYEGYYYDLARPVIFLVHGDGAEVADMRPPVPLAQRSDLSGVGAQDFNLAEDMRVWSYDKGDFSIRLDIDTGSFEDILLGAECADGPGSAYSGMHARIRTSGMHARLGTSGMHARMRTSGMHARTRGRDGSGSD